jgi:hypothetical protein
MSDKIITIYCFLDELLKALGHRDDPQARLTTAQIMTIALVAAEFFTGNQQAALSFLVSHHYLPPLSKSRFNRRLHRLPETLWQCCLFVLAQVHQQANREGIHIVDTCPIPVCRNIRIQRCKIYQDEVFRGYCASKKEYFYGLKLCLVVTEAGHPLEALLVPGSTSDIAALRAMDLNLPDGCTLLGDGGFLDRLFEKAVREEAGIDLLVPRRNNMKEQLEPTVAFVCQCLRKQVETTFSQLAQRFAHSIHAVTPRGFELKVFLTVLALSITG